MPSLGMMWANADNNYAGWGRNAEPWMLCGSPIQVEPFIVSMGLKIERMDCNNVQKLQMPDVVDATTNRVNRTTIVDKGIKPSATVCCLPTNHTTITPCTHNVEAMVYQYDRFFGYGCWMTSIPTITHKI